MRSLHAQPLALTLALAATLAGCTADSLGRRRRGEGATIATFASSATWQHGIDVSVWSGRVTDEEMECFWDSGVRHVIVGNQDLGIARQQMEMALAHGMTVDVYVYLVWDRDVTAQVRAALDFARSYPVGMLWLDVEEAPAGRGRAALEDLIADAADTCGDFPCGIYTAGWWWTPNLGDSAIVADLPLWYASYDGNPSIDTWPAQRFGGWEEPWGKQYAGDLDLCGIDVDLNTILVATLPSRPHPGRPPAPAGLPPAPTGLSPTGYERIHSWLDVRMLTTTITGSTRYEFAIESWNGSRYAPYFTYTSPTNARSFSPGVPNTTYRFRVRATNARGTGAWSAWSYFQHGTVSGRPPEPGATEPPPSEPPPSEPPPSEPPPTDPPPTGSFGAPSPADGARATTGSITLTRSSIAGAATYTFEIDHDSGGRWADYYTYSGAASSRTFWPTYTNRAYRWRVRADAGAWSPWSVVLFGAGASAPGTPSEPPPAAEPPPATPGAPTNLSPNGGAITTSAVTLRCDAVSGASSYELAVEVLSGGSWGAYHTYTSSTPSKTFYPATRGTSYRFRVRARTSAGWGPWSSHASFDFR